MYSLPGYIQLQFTNHCYYLVDRIYIGSIYLIDM